MKSSTTVSILVGTIVILALGVVALLLFINNQGVANRGVTPPGRDRPDGGRFREVER